MATSQRFCVKCGVQLLPAARFCVECGVAAGGTASARRTAPSLTGMVPFAILVAVLGVAGVAVWAGSRGAKPPPAVPPRDAGPGAPPGGLPEGHPPLALPDDVREKIRAMADAAKAKPDDLEAWQQLALVQYRAGQFDRQFLSDAAASYEHVLAKEPNNLDALRAMGNIAFDRDQAQEAIGYYDRYLKQKPGDPSVLTDLGTMYLSAKDTAKAMEIYQQVLAADPKFFQAQFNLAIAYRAAGDGTKAMAALEQARAIAPDEPSRKQIDELLAHVTGQRPAPPADEPPAGALRADVESVFRTHPIVGSRIERFDWTDDRSAKVVLRGFPMDGMPPEVRQKFIDRITTGVKEKVAQHKLDAPLRVELVDAASGRVMETVASGS